MLHKITPSKQTIESPLAIQLGSKFQQYFGKNIYLGNQKLKVYLSSWDKDYKISLTYTPYTDQKKWKFGFFKSNFSFYDSFKNQELLLLKKKKYIFVPKHLTLVQNLGNLTTIPFHFLFGEVVNKNVLKKHTLQLKILYKYWSKSTNKSFIKKIQQHIVSAQVYKRYFFFYLYQKNFHLSYFIFLNKYMHLFTKTNANLNTFSKYHQNPNCIAQHEIFDGEKNSKYPDLFSKSQKILISQLKQYAYAHFPSDDDTDKISCSSLTHSDEPSEKKEVITLSSTSLYEVLEKEQEKVTVFLVPETDFVSSTKYVRLKKSAYPVTHIYFKKHANNLFQSTEQTLYHNLLKVCFFVFPKFLVKDISYKLK